eukprot:GHRR01024289.1.p1 GENE.GHRR01024289.1~~GHRR01024289.1.p1  ORF type:complete len:288 (+),score=165.84 GHRR01024289.1:3270-4133(+)
MLAERKIQLEKEMQEMLDPTVGEGVVAAMKREVHRMELRHAELLRTQEKLMQELEKALSKHEIIGVKALAQKAKGTGSPGGGGSSRNSPVRNSFSSTNSNCSSPGSTSQAQTNRAIQDFKRSIRETEAEAAATQQRVEQLKAAQAQLDAQQQGTGQAWQQLQQQQGELTAAANKAATQKYQLLLSTSHLQRVAKHYEHAAAGKYKRQVDTSAASGDPAAAAAQIQGELAKASSKQSRLIEVLQGLQERVPELHDELDKVLAHAAAAATSRATAVASSNNAAAAVLAH